MKIKLNHLLHSSVGSSITSVPCSIDLQQLLEFNNLQEIDTDIHELLAQGRQIAVIWSTGDVQEVRADLNDDQAWEVLKRCEKSHDCNFGLTWEWIEHIADDLFPISAEGECQ